MLAWMRRSLPDSRSGMSSALGALDQVFNPGAARARELLDAQHERVIAVPSPGDRLLRDKVVHIDPGTLEKRTKGAEHPD